MIIIINDDRFHEPYNIILYIDDPFMDSWTYDPLQLTWIDAIFKITISHWSPLMGSVLSFFLAHEWGGVRLEVEN